MKRTILISGVTRGLGRAMLDGFAEQGHRVLGCGRSKATIEQLRELFGESHDFEAVDVSDAAQVQRWAARLLDQGDVPDLLLNNAAVINQPATTWEVPLQEFSRLIDINLKGVVHLIHAFVPAMVARKSGVIVNFSSGWGRSTSPHVAPYCLSKWGIEGLSQALAQELPAGMCSVALSPGVIETEMLHTCFGPSASQHQSPEEWRHEAVPFILKLGARDNGRSLRIP